MPLEKRVLEAEAQELRTEQIALAKVFRALTVK